MQRACALAHAKRAEDLSALIASKIEDLRFYDVLNMERALAVCFWGRSGSLLVTSYLDGHDDVVMLPTIRSFAIYNFFERYQSLSLHDKLIAYPIFSTTELSGWSPYSTDFFEGDFPIVAEHYYAAVAAIFEVYGDFPPQLLETRRAFFQFLHVAYSLALRRRPASQHPLMVYGQHFREDVSARRFVEDFPQAQFLHTVRDPITAFDRSFEHWAKQSNEACVWVIDGLTRGDEPHPGIDLGHEQYASRTCTTILQKQLADLRIGWVCRTTLRC